MRITKLNKAGDTIVEVMVVLAILGLSIGISYATAQRSLKNARTAQENAEATALLQSQLETLRYLSPSLAVSPGFDALVSPFCIDPTASNPSAADIIMIPSSCDNLGSSKLFKVQITYIKSDQSFELQATWDDVNATSGTDSVTLQYRTYD